MKQIISIGHIVNDTRPSNHMGGSVAYISVAARQLGIQSTVITKCPPNHPYVKDLKSRGVKVIILLSSNHKFDNKISTFENVYDDKTSLRTQTVLEQAEHITKDDLNQIDQSIFTNSLITIGTVVGEVETKAFSMLSQLGKVIILPQGYMRKIDKNGKVHQHEWVNFEKDIKNSQATVILSEEDITIDGRFNNDFLQKLINNSDTVILTKGANGSVIYEKSHVINIPALPVQKVNDLTGAGDVFSTAFLYAFDHLQDKKLAALFASIFATVKIENTNGIGLASIPTKEQFAQFIKNKTKEIEIYLRNNSDNNMLENRLFSFL